MDEYGTGTYNHQYILNAIDAMIYDDNNKGLILYINTPGGSVYASDEVYLKIREYQEITGRPVYSSMQSQATSGGYYISAPCDKIIANRNCWTGSIGVTMGTFIDLSELLGNLGIKTETITSGDNKSMGSSTEPMTDEQRAIFQALIDEAYEQFVGIVAEGRGMTDAEVKNSDGRYTPPSKPRQRPHRPNQHLSGSRSRYDGNLRTYRLLCGKLPAGGNSQPVRFSWTPAGKQRPIGQSDRR
ncbi:MAG: signal peptide peptidase SppA [Anaerovoracaceae bacterium]